MTVFPWLVLVLLVVALAAAILAVMGMARGRFRHGASPVKIGLASVAAVALPLLLAVLAWGLFLKPR